MSIFKQGKGGIRSKQLQEERACYLMLATQIIGFIALSAYPIIWTFRWAFYNYNGVESKAVFVGLENFIRMFTTDFTYWKVWGNTLLLALCKLPLELPLAMMIALLLSQKKLFGSNFFRTMYYLPNIISVAVVGLIFSNMFSYWGYINTVLVNMGIIAEEIDWFSTKAGAMAVIVISSTWSSFGVNVMYFMAALTNVPEELYECARLDGASPWIVFWKITLPMIVSVFKIILLMSIVGTLGTNESILALTNGGPFGQTYTVMSYLTGKFVPGFADVANPNLGYGCAMSIITTILFALIAVGYNWLNKKMQD